MSWLISALIASLVYSSTANYPAEMPLNIDLGSTVSVTKQKNDNGDETERIEKSYPLNSNGKISVSNVNGSISIEAWDKNEVKLVAIKTADSPERLARLQVNIESNKDSLRIETEYGNSNGGNWNCYGSCRMSVQYQLTVPRTAILNEIETVNGSVTISNMTNYTRASAVNGTVTATNLRGTAYIETVNGTTEASFESLNDDSKIELTTVNGRVNLTIPSDADATLKAETVNGGISNDFGLTVRKGKYVGRDMYGKVGDGRVKINLESVNGGLNIKRKQDGKNVKPVTNMLSAKDEDEEDISVEIDEEMSKDIAKAVSKSTKIAVKESMKIAAQAPKIAAQAMRDAEKAMAESSKEMNQVQREMEKANREMEKANRDMLKMNADWGNSATAWANLANTKVEERSQSFEVKGVPNVTVNAKSCPVSVKGWNKNEVMYRLTTVGSATLRPDVTVSANQYNSQITITTTVKGKTIKNFSGTYDGSLNIGKNGEMVMLPKNAVKMEVFVPKEANLKIVTDKEIRVEGISGKIDLDGNDGAINVRDSQGKLTISADDATIRVLGFTGEVSSKATDGTNTFEGDFTKFSAIATDGIIILTLPEESNADIKADTKIQTEGFDSIEFNGDETHHKIGNGETQFNLQVGDGQVFVRNAKTLISKS